MQALILVDLQMDFLEGGALAVPKGNEVIPVAEKLLLSKAFPHVIATQDWHPEDHGSFASNHPHTTVGTLRMLHGLEQVMWPNHCVQGTEGADFAPGLLREAVKSGLIHQVFQKGTDPTVDSYSGFFDNGRRKSTGLTQYLRQKQVSEVIVMGLATDYCVKFTALDALSEGFKTTFLHDGSRAVNLQPHDEVRAIDEMRNRGIRVTHSGEFT